MRMVSDMGYCLGHLLCHIDDHDAVFFFFLFVEKMPSSTTLNSTIGKIMTSM